MRKQKYETETKIYDDNGNYIDTIRNVSFEITPNDYMYLKNISTGDVYNSRIAIDESIVNDIIEVGEEEYQAYKEYISKQENQENQEDEEI